MVTKKEQYVNWCEANESIPLFMQHWWLDCVCDAGQWDVCLAFDKGGKIIGALPYYRSRHRGIELIKMPKLTPFAGIFIDYPHNLKKTQQKYAFEKRVLTNLIEQLPIVPIFNQCYTPQLTNWLPFYWKGFQQTTMYTYVIEDLSDLKAVFNKFKSQTRNKIRKAEKLVSIESSQDIDRFYAINKLSFERQGLAVPYTLDFLRSLHRALEKRKQCNIYFASDEKGQSHAAVFIVWDKKTAYNLAIGADPKLRNSGAVPLLLWQAIQDASKQEKQFDFEGSIMENLETLFNSFGGVQKPYFRVYKTKNKFYDFIRTFFTKI